MAGAGVDSGCAGGRRELVLMSRMTVATRRNNLCKKEGAAIEDNRYLTRRQVMRELSMMTTKSPAGEQQDCTQGEVCQRREPVNQDLHSKRSKGNTKEILACEPRGQAEVHKAATGGLIYYCGRGFKRSLNHVCAISNQWENYSEGSASPAEKFPPEASTARASTAEGFYCPRLLR